MVNCSGAAEVTASWFSIDRPARAGVQMVGRHWRVDVGACMVTLAEKTEEAPLWLPAPPRPIQPINVSSEPSSSHSTK